MKTRIRIIVFILTLSIVAGLAAGCSQEDPVDEVVDIHSPSGVSSSEDDIMDIALEMPPLTAFPAMFTIPVPSTGTQFKENTKAVIDYSNTRDGYVIVRFKHATKNLPNPLVLRDCKKNIARVKTVMRERELNISVEPHIRDDKKAAKGKK